jgi:autotransporter-associated beta strand protein/ELWxxDGT repeat protein
VVADLQPGAGSSNPTDLTLFNGSYYFTADGVNASGQSVGRELFRLNADGSVSLVADINAGAAGSDPGDFALFEPNGDARLLFAATGPHGRELYQLDTSGNVSLVFDINPGAASSSPVMLTEFSGKLYFTAFTSAKGREAYVVNNGGNVSLIADLNPGSASSDPSALFEFAGNLYFSAQVGSSRYLFREAPSGTSDPVLVNLGTGVTDPAGFVTFNDKLYFSALDPADGRELFAMSVSNNSRETVVKVANLDGTSASSSPSDFFVFETSLYFSATGASGRELFRLNSAGAIAQLDLAPGSDSSSPSGFVAFQGEMYFAATVGGTRGLWRLDTSTSTLAAVPVPLPSGVVLPQEAVFYALGDELFFAADGPAGRELYRLTASGVVSLAADVNAGTPSSNPTEVILFGGKVYFVASEAGVGRELFVLRRDPSSIRIDGNRLIFNDDAGDKDNRLVISSTGTHLVIVDQNGHNVTILTPIAGAAGDGTSQVIIPLASLGGVTALDIYTRGGNDSATFDLSANANSLLLQFASSTYDGGTNTAPGDKLRFVGDGVTRSVYTPDAATTGSGVVVVSSPTQTLTFSFLALEPVDFTGMAEAKLVTPATATGADVLTVAAGFDSLNGLLDALVVSGTVGGVAIETGHFFGNQSVVIVTSSGVDGSDAVTIASAANSHAITNLTIETGPLGQDSVQIGGNVTLAGQLNINSAAVAIQAVVSLGGPAAIVARGDTSFSAAGQLLASQVTITAGGAIALGDGSVIDAGSGTIGLLAVGNITLGRLITTNTTAAAISITSQTGSILDGGDSGGPDITAEGLGAVTTLQAAAGIGTSGNALDLAVRHLVTVTTNSAQYLHELDDLDSLNLSAGSATIHLTAGGQVQDSDGALDIVAGQLVLSAASAGTWANPLQTQLTALTATATTGDLYFQEQDGLTVTSATALATGGDVGIVSLTGNLALQSIQAQGLVTLWAQSGAILAGAAGTHVTAASLELQAASGIGTAATPLQTLVQKLEASGGTGGVFVANTGNLQIGGISPSFLNLTGLSAVGSGPIVVTTTIDMTLTEAVLSVGGSVTLTADSDSVGGGAFAMSDGTLIDAGSGTITLLATGNITLGRLVTTNATIAAISVTSRTGSILDGGDSGGANITAEGSGAVTLLQAATGIGTAGNSLDLAVRNLVTITTNGDQYLSELNDLSSLNLYAGSATIHLTAGGQVQDSDNAIDVQATGLSLVVGGAGTVANPLQIAVANLEAFVGAGGLFVVDSNGLTLGGVTADRSGVESTGGNISIGTSGNLLVLESVGAAQNGAIDLRATGDITLAALVASTNGNVALVAVSDIFASSQAGLKTASGTILLHADSDNLGGGTIQFAGNIDVGTGQVIFRFPDVDGVLSGSVRGQGGVVKQGPGTLTIAPASINTYTGTTLLEAGTLRVDGAIGAAGAAGTVSLSAGTTLTGGGDVLAPIFSNATSVRILSLGNLKLGDGSTAGFGFAGTLLVAAGDNVTLRDADLAELGIVTAIAGGGSITAAGGVEIGSGERISGSGSVSGNVVVLAGGMVTPGSSPGVVSTATGNVVFFADSIYIADISGPLAGDEYDQINVQGTVNVNGAVLNLAGGTYRPPLGTVFTLIENDDGGDQVVGQFRGLPEGATIRFGAVEATISYIGGEGKNDVILTVTDEFKIVRTITPDAVVVTRDSGGGGGTSFALRTEAAPILVVEATRPVTIAQGTDARPPSLDTRAVERLRVFLKVVDEVTGKEEGAAVDLDPRTIDDALGFFARYRFPNGRYRIYLQEAGKPPRLIIDISIRDGRAVSPEPLPDSEKPTARAPEQPAPVQPAPQQPAQPAIPPEPSNSDSTWIITPPTGLIVDHLPANERASAATAPEVDNTSTTAGHWSAAAAVLSTGLTATATVPPWRDRVRRLLASPQLLPRTRFHRHLRSLVQENTPPST